MKTLILNGLTCLCLLATPIAAAEEVYLFSAPPREDRQTANAIYTPIANYLSQVTGKKIVYHYPDNWLRYQSEMRQGKYDLVYDGAHFVSWRVNRLQHQALVTLPVKIGFVVVTRKDMTDINHINDLNGRAVCGFPPPNMATMVLYKQFGNPSRQPMLKRSDNLKMSYNKLINGQCTALIMRQGMLTKFDASGDTTKVIFVSKAMANQSFSASQRFSPENKAKITAALIAPTAGDHIEKFLGSYNHGKNLVTAKPEDYDGLAVLLNDIWGFEVTSR